MEANKMDTQEKMKNLMLIINGAMIDHFQNTGDSQDANLIMNVLLNMIAEYCNIMGTDPAHVFQQGINAFSKDTTTSIGGIGLEFE